MISTAQKANLIMEDPRWVALCARDATADGQFIYSVSSTGVYCRPSCKSRQPRPQNVQFHISAAAAEAAGFRPCKRCRPQLTATAQAPAAIVAACRLIDSAEQIPSLDTLAQQACLSRFHFHRLFKATTGLTPRAYATAARRKRLSDLLRQGESVTAAIYDAGYNSNATFYHQADRLLGMTAAAYRAGGIDTTIHFAIGQCTLGAILVARSERGICAITLGDDPQALLHDLQDRFARAQLIGADRAFEAQVAQVIGLIEQPAQGLSLPLDLRGTAFQQRVWQALTDIPPGQVRSYRDIARSIGAPKAMRAVAQACAANPLAVAIPCHRVVRTNGALSGYRWGVARKQSLLQRERKAIDEAALEHISTNASD